MRLLSFFRDPDASLPLEDPRMKTAYFKDTRVMGALMILGPLASLDPATVVLIVAVSLCKMGGV